MKLQNVILIPLAEIEFTRAECNMLMSAAGAHYDAKCREQAKPGGIVWGLLNRLVDSETATLRLNAVDIDLVMKILQDVPTPANIELQRIFGLLNDKYSELNDLGDRS